MKEVPLKQNYSNRHDWKKKKKKSFKLKERINYLLFLFLEFVQAFRPIAELFRERCDRAANTTAQKHVLLEKKSMYKKVLNNILSTFDVIRNIIRFFVCPFLIDSQSICRAFVSNTQIEV